MSSKLKPLLIIGAVLLLISGLLLGYLILIQKSIVLGANPQNKIKLTSSQNLKRALESYFFTKNPYSFLIISFTNNPPTGKPKISQSTPDGQTKLVSCEWKRYSGNLLGKLNFFVNPTMGADPETDLKLNRLLVYCLIRMANENDTSTTPEALSSQLEELSNTYSSDQNLIIKYQ